MSIYENIKESVKTYVGKLGNETTIGTMSGVYGRI